MTASFITRGRSFTRGWASITSLSPRSSSWRSWFPICSGNTKSRYVPMVPSPPPSGERPAGSPSPPFKLRPRSRFPLGVPSGPRILRPHPVKASHGGGSADFSKTSKAIRGRRRCRRSPGRADQMVSKALVERRGPGGGRKSRLCPERRDRQPSGPSRLPPGEVLFLPGTASAGVRRLERSWSRVERGAQRQSGPAAIGGGSHVNVNANLI